MYKNRAHGSVKELVSYVTHSLWGLAAFLFVILTGIVGAMFLRDSHAALCSLVEARLEGTAGPLSRELGLGEKTTSSAIFSELTQNLSKAGMQHSLELHEVISANAPKAQNSCEPGIFSAQVTYPLAFGNKEVARVTGTISYISVTRLLLLILSFFSIFFLAAKAFMVRLNRKLKADIIDPIIAISKNETLQDGTSLPAEVEEIQQNIIRLKAEVAAKERTQFELAKAKEINEIASGLAHDIGSPLSVLHSLASDSFNLSDENRRTMVRSAAIRLQDIAGDLLRRGKKSSDSISTEIAVYPVAELLESIVSEKRVEYRHRPEVVIEMDLGKKAYGIFVRVGASEFKSVVSNLINNAADAIEKGGKIVIGLNDSTYKHIPIFISDNGRGIPPEILPQLMESGATFNKPDGHGVGLFKARTRVEKWGGNLQIESQMGKGTLVTLDVPAASAPKWFVPSIEVLPTTTIAILDDEPSIHRLWKGRFEEIKRANPNFSIVTFGTAKELSEWHAMEHSLDVVYLIDYELHGQNTSGIELIESLGISASSILVTSRSSEPELVAECMKRHLKLIPKLAAGLVPIKLEDFSPSDIDCVLIDDDRAIRNGWKTTGENVGKKVQTFETPAKFFSVTKQLSREVPVYIDSNLGHGQKGELIAKEIFEQGFKNIYLATGSTPENLSELYWIKAATGKNPPWMASRGGN